MGFFAAANASSARIWGWATVAGALLTLYLGNILAGLFFGLAGAVVLFAVSGRSQMSTYSIRSVGSMFLWGVLVLFGVSFLI
jgi:hypothetical protein